MTFASFAVAVIVVTGIDIMFDRFWSAQECECKYQTGYETGITKEERTMERVRNDNRGIGRKLRSDRWSAWNRPYTIESFTYKRARFF